LDETRRHARDLAPTVSVLFREQDWKARDLTGVFVSLGPGSYTGLRVGTMTGKALAYVTGCAIVGVPSFLVLARQAETHALNLIEVADAQQDRFYVQSFRRADRSEPFRPADELRIVAIESLIELSRGAAVAGPGIEKVNQRLPVGATVAAGAQAATLEAFLSVGRELVDRGAGDDPLRLEPMYLRRSSAEEQWDRRPNS
jgi:tRNA threonylcarbamoyladenosine biosynthesis protein TsaB